jgi:C1A family cysteine protease
MSDPVAGEEFRPTVRPDEPDPQDPPKTVTPANLPASAQVSNLRPIRAQGVYSSCSGNAAVWFWEQILESRGLLADDELSRLYVWYWARVIEGDVNRDGGVQTRSLLQALQQYGAPPEEMWPYSGDFRAEPTPEAQAYGKGLVLASFERCNSIDDIRYAIAIEDQSVLLSIPIFPNWRQEPWSRTGQIAYDDEQIPIGSHAVVICGYDHDKQILRLANSWGPDWGDRGYCTIPYRYLFEDHDAWTARRGDLPLALNQRTGAATGQV